MYAFLPISIKNEIRTINKLVSNPDNDFNRSVWVIALLGIHTLGLVPVSEIRNLNGLGYGLTSWNSVEVYTHCNLPLPQCNLDN